jgi:tRNA 5-methylaminomethyl-2-thiouridine biosynthesis bifunctional protein
LFHFPFAPSGAGTIMTRHTKLVWQDGQPFSAEFGDVYFSRDSGLEETRHVFIDNNRLPERFAALKPGEVFTIGETGFGTGLNFLCAWQCFVRHAPEGARLSFVSVEKFPLDEDDLERALALWPELEAEAAELRAQYRRPPTGWHRFLFDGGRVALTLIIGDAAESLSDCDAGVDAWFLDGFSPALNPDMWTQPLFDAMAARSAPGASFATFTCAGFVRRGLQAAGFRVEKTAGYGSKREMSRGECLPRETPAPWQAPWFARTSAPTGPRQAIVIGGGVAGAASAWSLAMRGWQVRLIERNGDLAREGSGNAQGILYARLSAHATPLTRLVLSGYRYSLAMLDTLLADSPDWHRTGVLQLPVDEADVQRQADIAQGGSADGWVERVDAFRASELAGVSLDTGGLYFPQGGWLRPAALVERLCRHPGIEVLTGHSALELDYSPEAGHWVVMGEEGAIALGSVVVIAGAADTASFDCTSHLPLKRIRGQVTSAAATPASSRLATVLCHEGYVAPASNGRHTLGASFKFNADDLLPTQEEHMENLQMLQACSPVMYQALGGDSLDLSSLQGRAAYRCTSPDYLPLIGPVAARNEFVQRYRDLARDASLHLCADSPLLPGLFINTGHGSRGMVTGPLSGEILAAWIEGEAMPVPRQLVEALHPDRFLVRNLMRGRIDPDAFDD